MIAKTFFIDSPLNVSRWGQKRCQSAFSRTSFDSGTGLATASSWVGGRRYRVRRHGRMNKSAWDFGSSLFQYISCAKKLYISKRPVQIPTYKLSSTRDLLVLFRNVDFLFGLCLSIQTSCIDLAGLTTGIKIRLINRKQTYLKGKNQSQANHDYNVRSCKDSDCFYPVHCRLFL